MTAINQQSTQQEPINQQSTQQELLVGTWKLDPILAHGRHAIAA